MTNPCILNNIRLDLGKKAYEYTLQLKCCGVILVPTTGAIQPGNKYSVAANVDKPVPFTNPAPIRAPKTGSDLTLNFVMAMEKKGETGPPKLYDKTCIVPIKASSQPQQCTVLLGKVGSVTFMGDAVDEAERLRREQAERDKQVQQAMQAAQQKLNEEQQQVLTQQQQQQQREAEEAERQRLAQVESWRKVKDQQDAKEMQALFKEQAEKEQFIYSELEHSVAMIASQKGQLSKRVASEMQALEWERANRPPVYERLNPELRIAKLFTDPPMFESDPVFDAICAHPSTLFVPPPHPNDVTYSAQHNSEWRNNRSPPQKPRQQQQQPQQQSVVIPGPKASDGNPTASAIIHNSLRGTPMDVLHLASSDVDAIVSRGSKPFSAVDLDTDFAEGGGAARANSPGSDAGGNDEGDLAFLNNPDFQPEGKLYRRSTKRFELGSNPLQAMKDGAMLPPLDTLPRIIQNPAAAGAGGGGGDSTMTPSNRARPAVSFVDEKKAAAAAAGGVTAGGSSSRTASASANPFVSPDAAGSPVQDLLVRKQTLDPLARFEIELAPAPPLISALLHLSRNGGYMDATVPIEQQSPPQLSLDEQKRRSFDVFERLGPQKIPLSPNGHHHHHDHHHSSPTRTDNKNVSPHREHSMTPRRQLPLVYSDIGEVVSRTTRADARSIPSVAQPRRRQTDALIHYAAAGVGPNVAQKDPAQSYWNCFAPQKAQNLVGVRMPASAVCAFEEAASQQVLLTPGRSTRPIVPSANKQSPFGSTPRRPRYEDTSTLRSVVSGMRDAGESAAHRAARKF